MSRLVVIAERVYTGDPARPAARAVGIEGERVAAVGSIAQVRARLPGADEIPLDGATVLPGLADAHGHLLELGQRLGQLDLSAARDPAQIAAAVAAAAAAGPGWILGQGWDQGLLPGGAYPDRALLDRAAPGRLVFLERVDLHAALASTPVLQRAGLLEAAADPPGGRILRRPDGAASGVLIDAAMEPARALIPIPGPGALERDLLAAMRRCAALGLTCVHDAGLDAEGLAALERLDARGELPIRVYGMIRAAAPGADRVRAGGPRQGNLLAARCVKFFLDGALGSRGAALFEDYADEPGHRGLLRAGAELPEALALWMRAGFQVALHAIGDRANALALDALERCLPAEVVAPLRPRLEHAQILRLSDLPRLAPLGVVASMQPSHAASDLRWAALRLGPSRMRGAYAWRSVLRSGAALAFGSDFPIESPDPLRGIHAASTRRGELVAPGGRAPPEECLTRAEAVAAFTSGAAFASFDEARGGRLAEGARADLSAFSGDPLTSPAPALLQCRAVLTLASGRIAHGPC